MEKRYHSLDQELKQTYGQKIYKISLNAGLSCPNRDGKIDTRGCIFCSEGGSGDFAASSLESVTTQIEEAKSKVLLKINTKEYEPKFIAYFQAFTNTYAPLPYLKKIFYEAIEHPDIIILSIATRPDCLEEEIISLLIELNQIKPVWIELGLQTMHETTARYIRRGYPLTVFEASLTKLKDCNIPVIVHTILGLPGESKQDIQATMKYLGTLPIKGIKLQLLHILKGTDLGKEYENKTFTDTLSLEEYVDLLIGCLEILPEDIVIHRITGDGPKKLLLSPLWSANKKLVLNRIHMEMIKRDTWQGKYYHTNHK